MASSPDPAPALEQEQQEEASPTQQRYFCHECQSPVVLASPDVLTCPDCSSGFLEELTDETPPQEPQQPDFMFNDVDYMGPGFGQLLEDMSNFLSHIQMSAQQTQGNGEEGAGIGGDADDDTPDILRLGLDAPDPVRNPILLLQGRIQNLINMRNRERLGIDNLFDNPADLRIPGTIGDYYIGPGLDHLIQQLAENDPNKYGTPPASQEAMEGLPIITICQEHLSTDAAQCAVCKDEFHLGTEAKKMPCNHMYHADCILPWLEQHNTCPVCRYELPTDDPEYEEARAQRERGESSGSIARDGIQDISSTDNLSGSVISPRPISPRPTTVVRYSQRATETSLDQPSLSPRGDAQTGTNSQRLSRILPWLRVAPIVSNPTGNNPSIQQIQDSGDNQQNASSHDDVD